VGGKIRKLAAEGKNRQKNVADKQAGPRGAHQRSDANGRIRPAGRIGFLQENSYDHRHKKRGRGGKKKKKLRKLEKND